MDNNSMVWSEEETKYLKALLTFDANKNKEAKKKVGAEEEEDGGEEQPAGEFRILVVGAKECGKTSILTKLNGGNSTDDVQHLDPELEKGCRHRIRIEDQLYVVDAFEFPSKNLSSDPHLMHAISITEGAILIYDIKSRASLKMAQGIQELVRDSVGIREYGLVLVGNKSDCEDEEREVPWVEGHKSSTAFGGRFPFVETSAKSGDNIDGLFPELGREILKLRWLMQQRREHAERLAAAAQESLTSPTKRVPRWRSWARPWFHRRLDDRKASVA